MAFSGSSRGQKVLEKYKNKIAASLQHLDLPSFSERLLKFRVIYEQTNENISSMDYDHVDAELCTRYLLRKVSDSIGESDIRDGESSCWDRFVRALLDFSDPGGTLNIIGLNCMHDYEVSDTAAISKDEDTGNRRFKKADIARLFKVLIQCSYEWEGISIALNLPRNVIEECSHGKTDAIKLNNVLQSWVMGNHSNAEDPTYFNLEWALESPIVKCSAASNDLRKEFYPSTEIREQCIDSGSLMHQLSQTCVKFGASTLLEAKVSSSQPVASYMWNKDGKNLQYSDNVDICDDIICIQNVTDSGIIYSCCIRLCDGTIDAKKFYVKVIFAERDKNLTDVYSKFKEVHMEMRAWPPISPIKFINIALVTGQNNYINDTVKHDIDEILETKEFIEYDEVFGKFTPGELIFVEGRPGSGKTTLVHKVTRDWAKNLKGLNGAAKVYLVSFRVLNYTKKDKSLRDILSMFYLDSKDTTIALDEIKETSGRDVCFIFDGLDEYIENNKENIVMKLIYKRVLPQAMVIVASRTVGTAEHRRRAPTRIEVLGFTKKNVSEYINHYPFAHTPCAANLEKYLKVHPNILHMCYLPVHASIICYLYNKLGENIPNTETKIYENFTCLTIVRKNMREMNQNIEMTSLNDLSADQNAYFYKICKLALGMTLKSIQVASKSEVDIELNHKPGSDSPFLGLLVIDSVAEILGYKEMYTFLHLTSQEFLTAWYVASLKYKQQIEIAKMLMQKKQYQSLKFYFGLVNAGSEIFKEFYSEFIMLSNNDVFWMQCAFESQNQSSCQFIGNGMLWDERLLLSKHHLLPLDFAAIGYVFSNCSNSVSKLTLNGCIFDDDGIGAFLSSMKLSKLMLITKLKIISHNFPLKAINLILLHLRCLEELVLLEDNLSDTDLKGIADGVVLDRLKVFHVGLSIEDKDVAGLASLGSSSFQELHVYYYPSSRHYNSSSSLTLNHLLHAHGKMVCSEVFMISQPFILCCLDFYEISFGNFLNCVSFSFFDCGIDDGAVAIIALSLIRSSCMKQLKSLKLDMNNITAFGALFVASILKYSSSMQEFSIFGNKINFIGAEAIAESLTHCKTLRTVDMQLNAIGDAGAIAIARSAAKSNIQQHLYLCNSNVTEYGINEVLKYKKSGTVIRTPRLRIEEDILQAYPQLLDKVNQCCHNVSKIRVLDIIEQKKQKHEIPINFNQITRILEGLNKFKNLTHLDLKNCRIGEQGANILANELKNCSKLELLNLSNNKLYSPGTMAVAGALKCWPKLEVLNMSTNAFSSSECIASLADGLRHLTGIKELDFSYNCIGSDIHSVLVVELLSKLRKLDLSRCAIDSNGAKHLAVKLQHCSCLQHLNLQDNNMGSGMMDIVQALRSCQSLWHLNLVRTGIDADCMEVLAEGLKLNNQLQELCLAGNQFSQEAAFKLGRSLFHCNKLTQLHLQACCIDDKGAMALSEGLKNCECLDFVCLSFNQIGTEGAVALARNLKLCTRLRTVFLDDNPIEDEGAIELYEQLKHSRNIFVHVSERNLKEETQSKLMKL